LAKKSRAMFIMFVIISAVVEFGAGFWQQLLL